MRRAFIDEFKLILSDGGAMLILLFAMLIYTTIYSIAYGAEVVSSVDIAVVDEDCTPTSRMLIDGLRSGPNTKVSYEPQSVMEAQDMFYHNLVYGIVVIPNGFERKLLSMEGCTVSLILDGSHLLLYREVFEQAIIDALTQGGDIEAEYLVAMGADDITARSIVEPVKFSKTVLYNRSLGYGSFVMPSIVVVIIQQTLLIGVAMVAMRRRRDLILTWVESVKRVVARVFVYVAIYGVGLAIILLTIWQVFGFPLNGDMWSVVLFMILYIMASASLAQLLSYMFRRRESPMLVLLWSSIPILLLAGVSYPREAFPEWLYALGRIFPSSSAVDGFIRLNSMGASLYDIKADLLNVIILAFLYMIFAIILEKRASVTKI